MADRPSDPTLDIAVNLTWIAPGRVGGSEEYLVRQLAGIADGAAGGEPDLRLHLYCQERFRTAHRALTDRIDTRVMPSRGDRRPVRIAAEHSWLAVQSRGADVVHHAGGTAPLVGRRPIVLTVHDLQYQTFPTYFSTARRRYLATMVPQSVRRAAVIATPTEYVRSTVIDAFSVDEERVVVVPHGVPTVDQPDATETDSAQRRHGIDGPYVVYAAITHPHKAHHRLVEMMATTTAASHPLSDLRLVLLGGAGTAEGALADSIAESPASDRIVRTGRVSAADRDALVAGAEALVFPSEYEGFGAPLVEAMALGVPVVANGHPAIREVVGDAGLIVDEQSGEEWSAAVADAIARRNDLVERGRGRCEQFTVARSAEQLGDAYRQAATLGGRAPQNDAGRRR